MIFRFTLRGVLAESYEIFRNGLFRLIFGKDWYAKHTKYGKLTKMKYGKLGWIRHLFESGIYFVRRIDVLAQTKLPDGIILQPLDSIYISKEIYIDQGYDRFYKLQEDDVVIDVGAHVGVFSLKAAKRARTVVAIEPHPFNYRLLLRNIASNRLRNIIPMNLALSDYNGIAKLYIGNKSDSHTIKKEMRGILSQHRYYVEVEVKTLDQLMDELKISRVSFIKIDAEGAELDILKGGKSLLRENDVFLAIDACHTSTEVYEVSRYLLRNGFRVFTSAGAYVYAFKPSISSRVRLRS